MFFNVLLQIYFFYLSYYNDMDGAGHYGNGYTNNMM